MTKTGSALIVMISVLGVAVVGVIGFLIYQNKLLPAGINSTASPVAFDNDVNTPPPTVTPIESSVPTQATPSPVVIFESKASISAADLDQLQKRVVDPYLDYYKETNGADYIASLTIALNNQPSKASYPFTAKGIFKVGAYNDFLIEKNDSGIVWWAPECLNGCVLSDAFKAKYPQVAAKVQ